MSEVLDRIVAMSRWFDTVTSSRTEEWRYGTAVFQDDFPNRWDSNFLRVDRSLGDATAADLAASADEVFASLAHREVAVDDADGGRLADGFRELDYEVDRLISMVLRREPDHAPELDAREVAFEELRPLAVAANVESHGGMALDVAEMLADFGAVTRDRAGARFFIADVDRSSGGFLRALRARGSCGGGQRPHVDPVPQPRRGSSGSGRGDRRGSRRRRRPRVAARRRGGLASPALREDRVRPAGGVLAVHEAATRLVVPMRFHGRAADLG